jgi:hypothetical protein
VLGRMKTNKERAREIVLKIHHANEESFEGPKHKVSFNHHADLIEAELDEVAKETEFRVRKDYSQISELIQRAKENSDESLEIIKGFIATPQPKRITEAEIEKVFSLLEGENKRDYNSVHCVLACMTDGEYRDPQVYIDMSSGALKRLREALARVQDEAISRVLPSEDEFKAWVKKLDGERAYGPLPNECYEWLRANMREPNKAPNTSDLCICGHKRADHIYEEGACRPGFICECKAFTLVGKVETKGEG